MRLSQFIAENREELLEEFEEFARSHALVGSDMEIAALRNDAGGILDAIALDLQQAQTASEQMRKSRGDAPKSPSALATSAERHGTERAAAHFSLEETVAEYRALRASVLRLWQTADGVEPDAATLEDVNRFHEAIDQALAESIRFYSAEVQRLRKEREEENRRVAEAISRAKADFLQIVSHELRTPLNAISGYSSLLRMGNYGPMTEAQQNALSRMSLAEKHLLGIIDGILEFRDKGTGTPYEMEAIAVEVAAKGIAAIVEPIARDHEVQFDLAIEPTDAHVWADRKKLRQVLVNLISNALRFTQPGGNVRLDCRVTPAEVCLCVHDTGPGIPSDKLEAIFDPFVQLDMGLTRERGGVGLGLAISRQLVQGMGGRITAESELGRGSVFTVSLPKLAVGRSG